MRRTITKEKMQELREHFVSRQHEVLALTCALVESESPSGDKEGSTAVVSLLTSAASSITSVNSVERISSEDFGEHLRIRAFGADDEAGHVVLLGHTDTVHPRGTIKERPWRTEQNRVYGPGIFDMKVNCAVALEALRACEALDLMPPSGVTILLTCDEETGSPSGRPLVEAETKKARACLVLEPPAAGGRVKTARKGTGMFTIEVEGRAAHAGLEPEKGVSAVLELARQTIRLNELNDPANGTSVTVNVISGGTHSNVIPAEARAEVDLRFTLGDAGREVEERIRLLTPYDSRALLKIKGGINRPPLERTAAVADLFAHARSLAAQINFDLGEASVGGASDGNFVAALGVPVLDGLGVQGDGAHAFDEHIICDDIPMRGALLAALIATV
jgi:glutamate carboxypeptidase